jgi:DNA-binding PadR family transcriptional regulator
MESDGLVEGELVVQSARPNKRVFAITEAGRSALAQWIDVPPKPRSLKSEILVKMYGADVAGEAELLHVLEGYAATRREHLLRYEALLEAMLHGRSEAQFLRTAHRIGPYVTLRRGIAYERENVAWAEWALDVVRARADAQPARPRSST